MGKNNMNKYETLEDWILIKYGISWEALQKLEKVVNGEYHKNGLLKETYTLKNLNKLVASNQYKYWIK